MKPTTKLSVEALEAREVPAVFGNPWPNAGSLTLSFAPDNTIVAGYSQDILGWGQPSRLFSEMSAAGTTAQWQTELLRAFQTWAVNSNINIGLVPDGGTPFGPLSESPNAGSSGQIRVGAFLASTDVIAVNQAYSPLSGAWSGDLLFNTAKNFSIGNQSGNFDIYSVALNEAGNIFGLADTNDPASARYGHYSGVRTELIASDISAIKTLYGGARQADAFEVDEDDALGDTYFLNPFTAPTDSTKTMVAATGADLTTLTDIDHYKFKAADGTTSLTVRLETVGKSLLRAKVSVYNDQGVVVGTATSAGPQAMQDLVLTVNGVTAGKDYTVRVEKASNDVFGIGRYDLKVGFNFNPIIPPGTVVVNYTTDSGTNNTRTTATALTAVTGSANKLYSANAKIDSTCDVDFYKIAAPSSTPNPMTVTVTPAQAYGLYSKVTVYNAAGNVVPSEVLANGTDGTDGGSDRQSRRVGIVLREGGRGRAQWAGVDREVHARGRFHAGRRRDNHRRHEHPDGGPGDGLHHTLRARGQTVPLYPQGDDHQHVGRQRGADGRVQRELPDRRDPHRRSWHYDQRRDLPQCRNLLHQVRGRDQDGCGTVEPDLHAPHGRAERPDRPVRPAGPDQPAPARTGLHRRPATGPVLHELAPDRPLGHPVVPVRRTARNPRGKP